MLINENSSSCLDRSKHGRNAKKVGKQLDDNKNLTENNRKLEMKLYEVTMKLEEMNIKMEEQAEETRKQMTEMRIQMEKQNQQIIKGHHETRILSRKFSKLQRNMDTIHLSSLIDYFKAKAGTHPNVMIEDINYKAHPTFPQLASLTKNDIDSFLSIKKNRDRVIFIFCFSLLAIKC